MVFWEAVNWLQLTSLSWHWVSGVKTLGIILRHRNSLCQQHHLQLVPCRMRTWMTSRWGVTPVDGGIRFCFHPSQSCIVFWILCCIFDHEAKIYSPLFLIFQRSVLVDSPMSLSSSSILSHMSSHPAPLSSVSPATARRGGGKPATLASVTAAVGAKKGRKKKDPNEPQKPVSAYALFFRDTQAAIKGQNPNATFGDVSKIVASMWDGLGEEQKQVHSCFWCSTLSCNCYLWPLFQKKINSITSRMCYQILCYLHI